MDCGCAKHPESVCCTHERADWAPYDRGEWDECTVAHGDPTYLALLDELRLVHLDKSSSYGTQADPLANFRAVAQVTGAHPSRYAFERIVEKATRALNLIDAGRVSEVEECLDVAGLALCAESLRRTSVSV